MSRLEGESRAATRRMCLAILGSRQEVAVPLKGLRMPRCSGGVKLLSSLPLWPSCPAPCSSLPQLLIMGQSCAAGLGEGGEEDSQKEQRVVATGWAKGGRCGQEPWQRSQRTVLGRLVWGGPQGSKHGWNSPPPQCPL